MRCLRVREDDRDELELICALGCPAWAVWRMANRLRDPLAPPKRPPPPRPPGDQLSALRSVAAADYVERWTGREARHGMTRCPLHAGGDERTPSLQVNEHDGGWFCHACGVGGGVLEFYAALQGRPMPTANGEFSALVSEVHGSYFG
jgi:hypothetical protein